MNNEYLAVVPNMGQKGRMFTVYGVQGTVYGVRGLVDGLEESCDDVCT